MKFDFMIKLIRSVLIIKFLFLYDFDICYTSYLKRAIHTLNHVLEALDLEYLPVIKNWRLNERHYGALQGLNKSETAEKYGEEQVKIWRRSFDVRPPVLEKTDERAPINQKMYLIAMAIRRYCPSLSIYPCSTLPWEQNILY